MTERWELSGKWRNRPGRKPGARVALISRTFRLTEEQAAWLAEQGEQSATIRRLIEEAMQKAPE